MMLSMAFFGLKKFLSILAGGRSLLVGLAVLVSAVLTLLWQLEQVTLFQIISGSGTVFGLYLLWRQTRAAEKNTRATEESNSVAQANVRVAQEGHLTKGFTQAVEHLGHSSGSVRLSGAYELFHLARDTPDLRQSVLGLLCAHIRQTTGEPEYRKDYKRKPSEEIQSLLNLLFVQEHKVFTGRDININLQGSWLNGSDLRHARLEKAHLEGAQLHGAYLGGRAAARGLSWGSAAARGLSFERAAVRGYSFERAAVRGYS